jgi:hypothetical protein
MSQPSQVVRAPTITLSSRQLLTAEACAIAYITLIAGIATATGAFYVLFPELGALAHDVFTRPQGKWARSPVLLAITPILTGIAGTCFTRMLPYGFVSVLLSVSGTIAIVEILKSPVAPAISAGLLPLTLGVKSWWYPPGLALGTFLLAILSAVWRRQLAASAAELEVADIDDVIESLPTGYSWLWALFGFVFATLLLVELTGLRFILFPPLVVIGFEMFGHTAVCPWAERPLRLPLVCFLTASGGLVFATMMGVGPVAAACSMAWGVLILRVIDLHVPPALAVALLPMVMDKPGFAYPVSVLAGTLMLTLWFLFYRSVFAPRKP